MDTVLAAMRIALWIIGIWSIVSVAACLPVLALFRAQARRNTLRTREDRRRAWADAVGRSVATR
jgi:hypothetical protein